MSDIYPGHAVERDIPLGEILEMMRLQLDYIQTAEGRMANDPASRYWRYRRAEALGRLRVYALRLVEYEEQDESA